MRLYVYVYVYVDVCVWCVWGGGGGGAVSCATRAVRWDGNMHKLNLATPITQTHVHVPARHDTKALAYRRDGVSHGSLWTGQPHNARRMGKLVGAVKVKEKEKRGERVSMWVILDLCVGGTFH